MEPITQPLKGLQIIGEEVVYSFTANTVDYTYSSEESTPPTIQEATTVQDAINYLYSASSNGLELDSTLSLPGAAAEANAVGDALSEVNELIVDLSTQIKKLSYEDIKITSFKYNNHIDNPMELGSPPIQTLTFVWTTNKAPTSQYLTIKGSDINLSKSVEGNSYTWNDLNIGSSSVTFSLRVEEQNDYGSSSSTSSTYLGIYNGIYCGTISKGSAITSNSILTAVQDGKIIRKLQSVIETTFFAAPEQDDHIIFAAPTRYGTPTFIIDGWTYEWPNQQFTFKNASGYEEPYTIWLSERIGGKPVTVQVVKRGE